MEANTTLDLTPEEAHNYADAVVSLETPVDNEPVVEQEPEKALEEMSKAELAAKAAELGLSADGTKADLVERITLHRAAA